MIVWSSTTKSHLFGDVNVSSDVSSELPMNVLNSYVNLCDCEIT